MINGLMATRLVKERLVACLSLLKAKGVREGGGREASGRKCLNRAKTCIHVMSIRAHAGVFLWLYIYVSLSPAVITLGLGI